MIKLGVLGVGDLAEKMIRGLRRERADIQVFLSPRNEAKARALAKDSLCQVMPDNQAVVDAADVVIVAVRPWQLGELAKDVKLHQHQTLISVVSGISINDLTRLFNAGQCVRAMLSYAAEINRATVAVYPANKLARDVLQPLGTIISLARESELELATVSACMNGWFYFLLHDLQCWLVEKGLPADRARTLVLSNTEDCVSYAKHHESLPIRDLGTSIATPGTFTAQGLEMLGFTRQMRPGAPRVRSFWTPS